MEEDLTDATLGTEAEAVVIEGAHRDTGPGVQEGFAVVACESPVITV